MTKTVWIRFAAALAVAGAGAAGLSAYVLLDDPWPDGTVVVNLQLGSSPHLTDGSASWGASAESALASWNQVISRVQFTVVRDSTAPKGDGNGVNNVFFSNDIYGKAFGTNVLAVTTNWSRRTTRAKPTSSSTRRSTGIRTPATSAPACRISIASRCTSSGTSSAWIIPTTTGRRRRRSWTATSATSSS